LKSFETFNYDFVNIRQKLLNEPLEFGLH